MRTLFARSACAKVWVNAVAAGLLLCAVFIGVDAWAEGMARGVVVPKTALSADDLALVVNDDDPLSVATASYYQERRGIPDANVVRVRFPPGLSTMTRDLFIRVKDEIDRQTPASVQAYALAWTTPYQVDCMSMTSAVAMGFDPAYCSPTCGPTQPSGYFNSPSHAPFSDHKIRPAMMLAGSSLSDVKGLIDRGVAADSTFPRGTGYLLNTWDKHRSVRAVTFDEALALGQLFKLRRFNRNAIRNEKDVLFYFTGLKEVPYLRTLHFVPGAMADHLTSTGGRLTDSDQMSSLRWLEAGATASYGTVVEPCNHLVKFPHPTVAMWHYATGATVLEAYWKSVVSPGEGVFVGEPLAKPFAPAWAALTGNRVRFRLFVPSLSAAIMERATSPVGPYHPFGESYFLAPGLNELDVTLPDPLWYRVAFRPPSS